MHYFGSRHIMEHNKPKRGIVVPLLLCCVALNVAQGFPSDDFRYIDVSCMILSKFLYVLHTIFYLFGNYMMPFLKLIVFLLPICAIPCVSY